MKKVSQHVIDKYFLACNGETEITLVHKNEEINGKVDCWFRYLDRNGQQMQTHRAIAVEDLQPFYTYGTNTVKIVDTTTFKTGEGHILWQVADEEGNTYIVSPQSLQHA